MDLSHRSATVRPRVRVRDDAYLSALYSIAYTGLSELIGTADRSRTLEIGAGLGLAQLSGHDWLYSDVSGGKPNSILNCAEELPYKSASLDALVLKDTWHHIPDIEQFLSEAHRVLRPHGTIAVFEPYWGLLARTVYRTLHQEDWDTTTSTWTFPSDGPWDSNQALTYLMLIRDRKQFESRWSGKFALVDPTPHIGPSFLCSGGVSRRTFVSGRLLASLLRWEERRGRWFNHLRFFHVFGLVKR